MKTIAPTHGSQKRRRLTVLAAAAFAILALTLMLPASSAFAAPEQVTATAEKPLADLTLDDLKEEELQFTAYSLKQAASLGIPFASTSYSGSRQIFSYHWLKWTTRTVAGKAVRFGVGVQLLLVVTKNDADAKTSGLPFLAASATLGHASVDAYLRIRGASSTEISKALPGAQVTTFDVTSFQAWLDSVNTIKDLILTSTTKIEATRLVDPKSSRDVDPLLEKVVVTYALTKIADGETLADALDDLPKTNDREQRREIVMGVYEDWGIDELDREPTEPMRARAKRYVDSMVEDA